MDAITSAAFFLVCVSHIMELKEETMTFTWAVLWVWGILYKADDVKQM